MKKLFIILALTLFSLPAFSQFASDSFSDYNDGWLKKGYRGFVETGVGSGGDDSFFINTTHGYQFSEWFFAGGGLGYLLSHRDSNYSSYYWKHSDAVEYYGDMRLTIPTNSRFYPFVNVKIGGASSDYCSTFYLHTNIGVRVALDQNLGLSFGAYYNYVDDCFTGGPIVGGAIGFDF